MLLCIRAFWVHSFCAFILGTMNLVVVIGGGSGHQNPNLYGL